MRKGHVLDAHFTQATIHEGDDIVEIEEETIRYIDVDTRVR